MKKLLRTAALLLTAVFAVCAFSGCITIINDPGAETPSENTAAPADGEFDFTGADINGETVSFSELKKDNKVIMVNFWESWCGPCREELPALEKLYEKYREDGFVILGVYSDSEPDEIRSIVGSVGITYPVMPFVSELQSFRTRYVPTTVFFGPDGKQLSDEPVIGSMDEASWEEIIRSYLYE